MVGPGPIRARYSPPLSSWKLACSGAPGLTRFFPEANTIKYAPAARLISGNAHRVGSDLASVRKYPKRLMADVVGLYTSIQSGNVPSSSARVDVLSATNSEMMRWLAGWA